MSNEDFEKVDENIEKVPPMEVQITNFPKEEEAIKEFIDQWSDELRVTNDILKEDFDDGDAS